METASSTSSPASIGTKLPSGPAQVPRRAVLPGYVDVFADLPWTSTGDGRVDIISAHGFRNKLVWMENPGKTGRHVEGAPHRPGLLHRIRLPRRLTNSGKKDCILRSTAATTLPRRGMSTRTRLREARRQPKCYGHGIGAGDVNATVASTSSLRRLVRAPADPRTGEWKWHPDFQLGATGFIHAPGYQRRRPPDSSPPWPRLRHLLARADRGSQVGQAMIDDTVSRCMTRAGGLKATARRPPDGKRYMPTTTTPARASRSASTGTNTQE